ncbi:PucR family transcriptional regulator [Streptomyces sp. NPDC058989]|uniref:PucR family transcriptional regulator n=1 Tax=Streptomyces sp. NPDC058989 TaxID=3346686 RepID=UPI0036D15EAF
MARQLLLNALISAPAVPDQELAGIARSAGRPLPESVQAVAMRYREGWPLPELDDPNVLTNWERSHPYLLIIDPGRDTEPMLRRALCGWTAVLGPALPRAEATSSLRWARTLLAVTPEDNGGEGKLIRALDHLPMLLLLQDVSLVRLLTERWLHPLAQLTPHRANRITQTMLTWLECSNTSEAARRLGVHPQTIRYRMRQIERLFGVSLRDPGNRFELELALRGMRLLAGVGGDRTVA